VLVKPTLTKKNHTVFVITVAFLQSVSKIKEILALSNNQKLKGRLYWPFQAELVEFIHFSPILRVCYTFFSTRRIQKSPTRFLCIFKYWKDTKQQIDATVVDRWVQELIVQRRWLANMSIIIFFVQSLVESIKQSWKIKQLLDCRVTVFWGGTSSLCRLVDWCFWNLLANTSTIPLCCQSINHSIPGRSNGFSIAELLPSGGGHIVLFHLVDCYFLNQFQPLWQDRLYLRQIPTDFRDSTLRSVVSSRTTRCSNITERVWIFIEIRVYESRGAAAVKFKAKIALLAISSSIFICFSSRDAVSKGLGKTQLLQKVSFESNHRLESYKR